MGKGSSLSRRTFARSASCAASAMLRQAQSSWGWESLRCDHCVRSTGSLRAPLPAAER
jgi:hypothetical protein